MLVLAGTIGVIALAVIWFTRLRSRARRPSLDGDATTLGHLFQEDLRGLANALFRRKGGPKAGPGSTAARRLYLEMLDKAAATGVARDPDATPVEIAPRLANVFDRTVTDEITAAFVQSRYAGREPDPRLVAELERRWRLT